MGRADSSPDGKKVGAGSFGRLVDGVPRVLGVQVKIPLGCESFRGTPIVGARSLPGFFVLSSDGTRPGKQRMKKRIHSRFETISCYIGMHFQYLLLKRFMIIF